MNNNYLSLHAESAKRAIAYFFKQPVATLLILAMLSIAMTLPLTLYLGVQSSQTVLSKLSEVPQITVYMEPEANEAETENVHMLLTSDKRVKEVKFVNKEDGLAEMQKAMGSQDIVSMLDENPLPDAFVVTPLENKPEVISALQSEAAHFPMVESAQMDKEWMQTLYQFNRLMNQIFWFLAITLGVAFVLVAHNTIRLQILSSKEEIEITKLLGAPSAFVRRPFLYQAAFQSFWAVVISLCLCTWVMLATQPVVSQIVQPYGINLQWRAFTLWEMVMITVVVVVLGMTGAWLAVTQHLYLFRAKRN
ncbi:permease-like cell division protein FtsX [Kingella negevensis]|uniref:Cell division protein FtsX n=1 Tax=Kingella negevensis TaxID=1522312 RepID=A0A238HF70_9NEIS|nr:permease-like cell division protein FtsX [Kingella negevensis]MDK4679423.1 permease-like cell division protein FtsX [Kingella negevensis]MDK4682859.1 permease-like cell division protein FtsX [Kingella negevensis]MDK4684880.1 permease-like cell division protein FtsX [Kingella negevensis]MDK4691056.1 permease-like cell division protein FtsX [Kingella negevensis]MDK4693797.1 permease-like cell division protein FtsX [Kingella negevensis]